jgi:hypothetical protein
MPATDTRTVGIERMLGLSRGASRRAVRKPIPACVLIRGRAIWRAGREKVGTGIGALCRHLGTIPDLELQRIAAFGLNGVTGTPSVGFGREPRAEKSSMFDITRRIAGAGAKAPPRKMPRSLVKSIAFAVAAAGALAGSGGAARAGVLTQVDDFAFTQINPNESIDNLPFHQFDSTLGTLQGITIGWAGVQEAFLVISSSQGGPWQLALNNTVQLSDADTPDLLTNSLAYPLSGDLSANGIPSTLEASSGIFTGQTNVFGTDAALFKGTGTVDLTVTEGNVTDTIIQSAPYMQAGGGTSDVRGTVELDYLYTPATVGPRSVAEPTSAALFGTALFGLAISRGRRKRWRLQGIPAPAQVCTLTTRPAHHKACRARATRQKPVRPAPVPG